VLDYSQVWDALETVQHRIYEFNWEEHDTASGLDQLVHDGAVLSRLAGALRQAGDRPDWFGRPETPITDPLALRERIGAILLGEDDPDPEILLSGQDLHNFVHGIHAAVADFAVPGLSDYTEDAGATFYRLARLSHALSTAASGAGSYIYRRVHDMERFAGRPAPAAGGQTAAERLRLLDLLLPVFRLILEAAQKPGAGDVATADPAAATSTAPPSTPGDGQEAPSS
jgi:hypothetical protein